MIIQRYQNMPTTSEEHFNLYQFHKVEAYSLQHDEFPQCDSEPALARRHRHSSQPFN